MAKGAVSAPPQIMKLSYFGDSYDIVKKTLLQWLSPYGPWSAHPMFTEPVDSLEAERFSRFLGVPLVSEEVLRVGCDRRSYFQPCSRCQSLFLDPDTGVRLKPVRRGRAPRYIFADELIDLVGARPGWLTLVFDQALAIGSEHKQIRDKLKYFAEKGVHGFAYMAQASFIVLAQARIIRRARQSLLKASGLPTRRIVSLADQYQTKTAARKPCHGY
jgi:hypothetical protein